MSDRALIVNADDFGQSPEVNRGVLEAFDHGIVTSSSLMVRWPAAEPAARQARARPELDLGLHVDLAEFELAGDEWKPLYSAADLSDASAVAAEARRQLEEFRRLTGADPSHLDSHQHLHRSSPLREVLFELADELAVPLRHFCPKIRYVGDFYGQPEPGRSDPDAVGVEALIRILEELSPGVSELCCHPGSGEIPDTMYSIERNWELDTLCHPRVRTTLDRESIRLRSFGK